MISLTLNLLGVFFLVILLNQKRYLCLNRSSGKIIVSRYMVFHESKFSFDEMLSEPYVHSHLRLLLQYHLLYMPISCHLHVDLSSVGKDECL